MNPLVTSRRDGNVAVIIVDNPPVNALKRDVRAGILHAFEQARDDAGIAAIVLTCTGRTFMAGADITEFGKPPAAPGLGAVIAVIEAIGKPTVAAVHGTPLGGGLETALACHFRVAAPGTRLGLPEIKLGIIPGAGGTQRLPRLVGAEKGLAMILTGEPIPATEALAAGLVDAIVEGDLVEAAVAFARAAVADKRPLVAVRDRVEALSATRADPTKFEEQAAAHLKRARGLHAPAAAVDAVRAAFELPFEEGLKLERARFEVLVAGDQSRAQRHIFFAEREAAKVPGLAKDVKPRDIRRAAVIGAGTMGGGIAMCFANAGIPVTLVETARDALARGLHTIAKTYKVSVSRGSLGADEMERRLSLINGVTDLGAVAEADMAIEAVFEDMDLKKRLFGDLDRHAKPDAILATNTSYLDVNAIAASTQRPESVLGTHFFSPANVMRLLEVVRAETTSPATLATGIALGRKLGKVPVVVGVCHGFVGNRMLSARGIEAERLLLEGALPQDVDGALVAFGFPMGPFAMNDLAGLDVSWHNRKALGTRAEIADQLVEAKRLGQKTGRGFYLYETGSRVPKPDSDVTRIVEASSQRLGITRRRIEPREIVERLVLPMINEGARILEERIAYRSSDIDVIWVYGYGFPAWRGGPMFYADAVGLPAIRDRLSALAETAGNKRHVPATLLARLAAEGRGFASIVVKGS